MVNALHLGYGKIVPLNRRSNHLPTRGIGCSEGYDTSQMVIQHIERIAPSIPDATPSQFQNEAAAEKMISAFAEKCNSPYTSKIVQKLHEFIITAKQDVIKISVVRRTKQPAEDIPIVDGHHVTEERMYAPHNPAGQSFGKSADLAVL